MAETTVVYSPLAQNDLIAIKEYISVDLTSPKAAENTIGNITKRVRDLAVTPEIGTPLSTICTIATDYRFLVSGNYLVFYRHTEGVAYVIRILYGKMNYLTVLFGDELDDDPIDLYGG